MGNNNFLLMTDTELECIYGGSVSEANYTLCLKYYLLLSLVDSIAL